MTKTARKVRRQQRLAAKLERQLAKLENPRNNRDIRQARRIGAKLGQPIMAEVQA